MKSSVICGSNIALTGKNGVEAALQKQRAELERSVLSAFAQQQGHSRARDLSSMEQQQSSITERDSLGDQQEISLLDNGEDFFPTEEQQPAMPERNNLHGRHGAPRSEQMEERPSTRERRSLNASEQSGSGDRDDRSSAVARPHSNRAQASASSKVFEKNSTMPQAKLIIKSSGNKALEKQETANSYFRDRQAGAWLPASDSTKTSNNMLRLWLEILLGATNCGKSLPDCRQETTDSPEHIAFNATS